MGPASSVLWQQNLTKIQHTCRNPGIPLAEEKLEGPTTSLTFLGIVLDTFQMEIRLPTDKLQRTQKEVKHWLGRKKPLREKSCLLLGCYSMQPR